MHVPKDAFAQRAARAPSKEALRAAARHARIRREIEARETARRKAFFRWFFLVVGALAVVAMIADARRLSEAAAGRGGNALFDRLRAASGLGKERGGPEEIAAGFGKVARWQDPEGRFSLEPPAGWKARDMRNTKMFQAAFDGPKDTSLSIQAAPVPGETEATLWKKILRVEREMQAQTGMRFEYVGPRRVIVREAQLYRNKFLFVDFAESGYSHHIQFAAPPAVYETYKPLILKVLESYRSGSLAQRPHP
jgi:hypothetical protein